MSGKILALATCSMSLVAACMPISGDRILGRDLALAEPVFAGLPATLAVGFAPGPGEKRILATAELGRIARAHGIDAANIGELCFELPSRQIAKDEVVAVMRRALPSATQIDILEMGKSDAPPGELEFPATGLEPVDVGGNRLWRGWVRYTGTRKLPIWARVRLQEEYRAVVALRDAAVGTALVAAWLRVETRTGQMPRETPAKRIEDVQGLVLKRAVKAGDPIAASVLALPLAVRRGDTVRVEVESGWARLHFEAVAEADAHTGDLIALRNPVSGKTFRARVGGLGKATVVIGGSAL